MDVEDSALIIDVNGNPNHGQRPRVELTWTNVNCFVEEVHWSLQWKPMKKTKKTILSDVTGVVQSGSVTAIIGPSGAGKSTLLTILSGRKTHGVEGNVMVAVDGKKKTPKVGIAFMEQRDIFSGSLTVRETLMFASKLKNFNEGRKNSQAKNVLKETKKTHFHSDLVSSVIQDLYLSKCEHTRVSNCSGGQRKRLSIACELLSQPDILILDEPTSGLDSFSAFQCMQLLHKLAKDKSLAIVASIHQPSSKTLNLCDHLYVLSYDGKCIYNGKTGHLLTDLSANGLDCPMFYNPADFVTEVASLDHGKRALGKLIEFNSEKPLPSIGEFHHPIHAVIEKNNKQDLPFCYHTWILFLRSMLIICREPLLASLCLSQHVMVALAMGFLYSENAGQSNGCYGQYGQPGGMSFDALKAFRTEESKTNQNIGFLFINTMFIFLSSLMSTVLTFPLEIGVFEKETANKWYSCGSYYTARSLADAPFRLLYPILHSIIVYQMTGQIEDNQRFVLFVFINILVAFLGQSKGMMFGAIYANKVEVACFVAPVSSILPFLFSGFFVNLSTMPMWLKPLEILSYYKYGFDSLLTLFYGFHRCDNILESIRELNTSNPFYDFYNSLQKVNISLSEVTPSLEFYLSSVKHVSDALIDEVVDNMKRVDKATITMFDANSTLIATDSYVMSHFNLDDSAFYSSIVTLFIFIIVFRLVAYIVLLLKSKQFK